MCDIKKHSIWIFDHLERCYAEPWQRKFFVDIHFHDGKLLVYNRLLAKGWLVKRKNKQQNLISWEVKFT